MYLPSHETEMMNDFETYAKLVEEMIAKKEINASRLGLCALLAGILALLFSQLSLGLALLVLALHWDIQAHLLQVGLAMTKNHRALAHRISSIAPQLKVGNSQ